MPRRGFRNSGGTARNKLSANHSGHVRDDRDAGAPSDCRTAPSRKDYRVDLISTKKQRRSSRNFANTCRLVSGLESGPVYHVFCLRRRTRKPHGPLASDDDFHDQMLKQQLGQMPARVKSR